MNRYVEIVNSSKVRSNTNLTIPNFCTNRETWKPYKFYPNNGVVGMVIGEAQSYDGVIYLVQCSEQIVVPILPAGIRYISQTEFNQRYPENTKIGRASEAQMNSNFDVDEMMDSMNKMFGF